MNNENNKNEDILNNEKQGVVWEPPQPVEEATLTGPRIWVRFNPFNGYVTAITYDIGNVHVPHSIGDDIPVRVDVKEWARHQAGKLIGKLEMPGVLAVLYPSGEHDIQSFGYWTATGEYVEPADAFREGQAEARETNKEKDRNEFIATARKMGVL